MSPLCPCGSALEYSSCCQPYLAGAQLAPDPSQLMRSRYSAFVMKDADYLIKTWHPSCQAQQFRADLENGFTRTQWQGLTVFAGTRPLIGRNDPCPCGSGKKFKKCCGQ